MVVFLTWLRVMRGVGPLGSFSGCGREERKLGVGKAVSESVFVVGVVGASLMKGK